MNAAGAVLALCILLGASGCLVTPPDPNATHQPSASPSHAPSPGTPTYAPLPTYTPTPSSSSPPGDDHAPTGSITASATHGVQPLRVNFTLTAADVDGDQVLWSFDAGYGELARGTTTNLPAHITYNYTIPGDFTARLTVTDRVKQTSVALVVHVAPAARQPIQHESATFGGPGVDTCTGNDNLGGVGFVSFRVDPRTIRTAFTANFTSDVQPVWTAVNYFDDSNNGVATNETLVHKTTTNLAVYGFVPYNATRVDLAACGGSNIHADYVAG